MINNMQLHILHDYHRKNIFELFIKKKYIYMIQRSFFFLFLANKSFLKTSDVDHAIL